MAIENILEEMENLVIEGKHIIFTNQSIINEQDLLRLIDELQTELPQEMDNAQKILREKEEILTNARAEADSIIAQAKEYAQKIVDESEIVRQAKEQADLIRVQSEAQEKEIMERTMAGSQQLQMNANQYANQVFDHLIANVSNSLAVLQQAKDDLNGIQPPQPLNTQSDAPVQEY